VSITSPIRLTDSQLDAIMRAAAPLPPDLRSPFLAAVAHALAGQEIGDGLVARTCRALQREFFDPPELGRATSKYSRRAG
jgi:hypothetical protein